MFVDASVIVAMMTDEGKARELGTRLEMSEARLTSVIALFEATAGVARVLASIAQAKEEVAKFLKLLEIEVVALPPEVGPIAIDAFSRQRTAPRRAIEHGRLVRLRVRAALRPTALFTGSDFSKTDIEQV